MPRKMSDEEFALLPIKRQQRILKQREYSKKWKHKNKSKTKLYQKAYIRPSDSLKKQKIFSWKVQGFKHTPEEFDAIYAKYKETTECELCSAPVMDGGNKNRNNCKCADHDHLSGRFRNVVCRICNIHLTKQDKMRRIMMLEVRRLFVSRRE